MKPRFLLSLALMLAPLALADIHQASQLVREGKPADALDTLMGNNSAEAGFWRGRALIDLGRTREAIDALRTVPAEHSLYPYAAKALLYCAWQNNDIDFAVIATPMATGQNAEIATLATAALAEYWLNKPKSQDNSALERLRGLVQKNPEYTPLLRLLEIENLRQRGEFDKAEEQCRALENDTSIPADMRDRARLALSSIYYDKEAAAGFRTGLPTHHLPESADDAEEQTAFDDGKGEETLLHFISSHPDSPLLDEAFRRLYRRNAFNTSEYARAKLDEWAADPLKSRRAANALLILQHMRNLEDSPSAPLDVYCANTAAATCPNEPATRTILLEQTRWYLERNQTHEALLYMGMLSGNDATRQFYEIQMHNPSLASTAKEYMKCARIAPEELRDAALRNALLCALMSGDEETQLAVMTQQGLTATQRYALLRTRAAFYLDKAPDKAETDINTLLSQPAPDANLRADVEMDLAYLRMQSDPQAARNLLQRYAENTKLPGLTTERQLRFFALQEAILYKIAEATESQNAGKEAIQLILAAAGKVNDPRVVAVLTLHLAHLQTEEGLYEDALRTLQSLLRKFPRTDFAPRALYMSAKVSENIGTMASLYEAVKFYETCAEQSEELRFKATTRKAAVLLRLGELEEAEQILTHLLRNTPDMRSQDKMMANAILANTMALYGTDAGRREAVEIAGIAIQDPELPRWWRFRALLHHATLCARADMYAEALKGYEAVLAMQPAMGESPSKADWHILYSAGSGAVMQLLHLKQYDAAADKADQIAAWNKEEADDAKRRQFSDWAAFIRQTNFVDSKNLPF